MKFHQNCEIRSDLSNLVWFGMAFYGLVEFLKLHVGSGRLCLGPLSFDKFCGGFIVEVICRFREVIWVDG